MSQAQSQTPAFDGPVSAAQLISVQIGAVVSRTLVKQPSGNVTAFAFDAGEGLSEHTTPYQALIVGLDGNAEVTIAGTQHTVHAGDLLTLPAGQPHGIVATTPFKMLLIMIRA